MTATATATMSDQQVLDAAQKVIASMGTDVSAGVEPAVTLPAPVGPLTTVGPGTYLVGEDMKAGTYKTAGPSSSSIPNCYWSRNTNDSGEFNAIIANGTPDGQSRVTVKKGEVFTTSGCTAWEATN
ncbi:hypothetical protein [Streptomyces sp. NPDC060049]|uniref:hypothetical protein n=1 Tax=Streptomyces sp. NPDC060049 TaxID=3347046 RepID=UPI0036AE779D